MSAKGDFMKRINYKSDFDFILKLADRKDNTKTVPFPDCNWRAVFWTGNRKNAYTASHKDGVYTNCLRTEDGGIHFVFKDHRMGVGTLQWEPLFELPNDLYPDNIQDLFSKELLNIELVTGAGDCGDTAEVEAMLPYIKGDKGDTMTFEDLTPEDIEELQRPATEAAERLVVLEQTVERDEATRQSNEQTRIAGENKRESNEQARQTAEDKRVANENHRIEAEGERHRRETLRLSDEETRRANETIREENEDGRVAAEAKRVEVFAGFEGKIDGKMDGHYGDTDGVIEDLEPLALERAKYRVFVDQWNRACVDLAGNVWGRYNEETGFFELNGLTDITYEEALDIYRCTYSTQNPINDFHGIYAGKRFRTNLPLCRSTGGCNCANMFQEVAGLEVAVLPLSAHAYTHSVPVSLSGCFRYCSRLRVIYRPVDCSMIDTPQKMMAYWPASLEVVELSNVRVDVDFGACKNLTMASLRFLVDNASNTTAITVTVHPDVFAKLTDENNVEWHSVLTDAMARNITFATV